MHLLSASIIGSLTALRDQETDLLISSIGFRGNYVGPAPDNEVPWDIHSDGKRLLMIKPPETTTVEAQAERPEAAGPRRINIVLNRFEELKERAPVE